MSRSNRGCFQVLGLLRPLVSIALLFPVLGACDATGPDDLDDLREARALWVSLGITDYRYTLQRGCFCTIESIGPVTITVRGGVVESLEYAMTGEPVTVGRDLWPTIDGLFDLVEQAVEGGADRVTAMYDSARGHPLTVDIDYIEQAIDDELTLTVTGFQPLVAP